MQLTAWSNITRVKCVFDDYMVYLPTKIEELTKKPNSSTGIQGIIPS